MFDIVAKLSALLGPRARRQAYSVFLLVLVMAIVETMGVASIMPFIALLSNPGVVETNRYLAAAYRLLGFGSTDAFLVFLGSATLILLVGSVALRALALWVQLRFINMQTHVVSSRMIASYLRQPYEWFLRHRSADIGANVLNEVTNVFQGVTYPVMLLVANGLVATLLMGLLIAVDPLLAAVAALVLGGVYLLVYLLGRTYLQRIGEVRVQCNRERHQALYETFGGVKDIKVAGVESVFLERYRVPSERMARAGVTSALVSELPSFVMQAVVFGGMLAVMIYLIVSHGSLQEALPVISLYALAGYRLLPTLQSAYRNVTAIRFNTAGLEALYRDLMEFARVAGTTDPVADELAPVAPMALRRELRLENLTFRYSGAEQSALENVDLVVPAFSTVALVGTTGSGKTTAVDVILGLLQPTSGRVLVDGEPVGPHNLRAWRRAIGYVPQKSFLCDDSFAANIAFGIEATKIDRDAVERAARIANLHDFIVSRHSRGYDSTIGERGAQLSGGQQQRIAIARALYHDPPLLIFDEATSSLDVVTEQTVMEEIYGLARSKTIIVIAHRLSTVRACDRIYLLERGHVVDSGTYDDLVASSEIFRAMVAQDAAGHAPASAPALAPALAPAMPTDTAG